MQVCTNSQADGLNWSSPAGPSNSFNEIKIAYLLSQLARLTYDAPDLARARALGRLGFVQQGEDIVKKYQADLKDGVEIAFPDPGSAIPVGIFVGKKTAADFRAEPHAMVVRDKNDAVDVVAVRGSQGFDYVMDFNFSHVRSGGINYHHGFYVFAGLLYEAVRDRVARSCGSGRQVPLWLTGHSMGGAVAQILAMWLAAEGCNVGGVMTFGSPFAGDETFRDAYARGMGGTLSGRTHRWVIDGDVVPCLPPNQGYTHVGWRHGLTQDGQLRGISPGDVCFDGYDDPKAKFVAFLDKMVELSGGKIAKKVNDWLDKKSSKVCSGKGKWIAGVFSGGTSFATCKAIDLAGLLHTADELVPTLLSVLEFEKFSAVHNSYPRVMRELLKEHAPVDLASHTTY